ncbi:MAG: hypothetical protein JRJ62_10755 [Deltaproteobacteria bacterium]|nr:hypothetical protein [Deltaproteobacteria bacterium]MBW2052621.1 hypothetical protein [Deltaproteobacteria bacterium]MBW2142328.1 hypothetical protein [Deltaproteobacteria bacterium]MBW2324119.1 hypothetical protein [Deltaproteobacteria bacterium]
MIAVVNGKLFTITQGIIEEGSILIEDGQIAALGDDIEVPSEAEFFDAGGKVVKRGSYTAAA